MENFHLNSSSFLLGIQCSKALYFQRKRAQQRDKVSESRQLPFKRSKQIYQLARKLFPGGVDCVPDAKTTVEEKVAYTQSQIQAGASILYDATFQVGDVFTTIDMLVLEAGSYCAYEVKSSSKISPNYLLDAALHYFVISRNGIILEDIKLITLNPNYKRKSEIEPQKLFLQKSVKEKILGMQQIIAAKMEEFKQVLQSEEPPEIQFGEHCHSPHSCDFIGVCRGEPSSDSILYLQGASKQTTYALFYSGVEKITQLPSEFPLTEEQKLQLQVVENGHEYIDKQGLQRFFEKIKYPLFFLDFEMFMPAIPMFEGNTPYQHLPFLYSIHKKVALHEPTEQLSYLAETGMDPTEAFIDHLIQDLGNVGTIFIFDATHEKRILNKAAHLFSHRKAAINLILNRIIDLSLPFQNRLYYHQEMKGSYSMKTLLPLFAPSVSFDSLRIRNGMAAMSTFEHMQQLEPEQKAKWSEALIDYCKMDTFGLVKIAESLMLKAELTTEFSDKS